MCIRLTGKSKMHVKNHMYVQINKNSYFIRCIQCYKRDMECTKNCIDILLLCEETGIPESNKNKNETESSSINKWTIDEKIWKIWQKGKREYLMYWNVYFLIIFFFFGNCLFWLVFILCYIYHSCHKECEHTSHI